jgi:hypothetical protein
MLMVGLKQLNNLVKQSQARWYGSGRQPTIEIERIAAIGRFEFSMTTPLVDNP